jgi:hypothetical protein
MPENTFDERGRAEVDDVIIEAPGLEGEVTVERPAGDGTLRGGRSRRALDDALGRMEMQTQREIVIAGPRQVGPVAAQTRGARRGPRTAMTMTVPGPPRGHEQAVLSIDEHGVATWHLKGGRSGGRAVRGGQRTRTYVIERTVAPTRGAGKTRGLVPGLDKVIRVITFPIASAIGRGARCAAREWDVDRHPPLVRAYGPTGRLTDLDDDGWKGLADGAALLFVHGTFSTTEGGFGRLPADTRKELHRRYQGRVIAYDHPTIADDPMENARKFFEIVGDRSLKLDIVCHSRGGLVSRSIAERPGDLAQLAPGVDVRSIILVGVPNNGTILAEAKHWNELLDRFTTLLNFLPGPGVSDMLESVLAVVRSIAVQTVENLEGLDSMAPHGDFVKRLNVATAGAATYRAIVSDFEPKNPGLKAWLNDSVRDAIFDHKPNDMMVTIESMTGQNGSSRFPVTDLREFHPKDAIEHSDYFPEAVTRAALLDWLPG